MRRAIARDVIAQVAEGTYRANSVYFVGSAPLCDVVAHGTPCEVCGIGALFVSKARLFNDVPSFLLNEDRIGRHYVTSGLSEYFTVEELSVIESTFEWGEWGIMLWDDFDVDVINQRAVQLVCIMDNIARNGKLDTTEPPRVELVRRALADAGRQLAEMVPAF